MTEEEKDFIFFKENQLYSVDFETGTLDVIRDVVAKSGTKYKQRRLNVGSINEDGYVRVWCGPRLRMKHRLLYWLYHGEMPEEIDHIDRDRSNNSIHNLRSVDRSTNNQGNRYKGRRVFKEEEIHEICVLLSEGELSHTDIAKLFGCSRMAISGIAQKRRHKKISDMYF